MTAHEPLKICLRHNFEKAEFISRLVRLHKDFVIFNIDICSRKGYVNYYV